MSTFLVTGAAGFIASRTCELLLDAGHTVVGVDNLNSYYDIRLKEHRLNALERRAGRPGTFVFHPTNIEDKTAVDAMFRRHRFDAVLNLAARAGVRYSLENPYVYLSTNGEGSVNLLEAMRASGVKKFVLASTSSLYSGAALPFREDAGVVRPVSPYAATKLAAEAMAYTYHHLFGIDVSVLRYFTVYGPAGRPDMSPYRFVQWIDQGTPIQLYGDGTQTRDFTYIDDIAAGTVAALRPLGYEIINLGGGNQPLSINRMIKILERYLGKTAIIDSQPANKADLHDTQADISKARRLLDWEPKVRPEEGFRHVVDWWKANREWLLQSPA